MDKPNAPYRFTPTEDFFSPELRSQYCAGLKYTVKADDAHAPLHALVSGDGGWLDQGKVVLLNSADQPINVTDQTAADNASISGTGQVI